MKKYLSIALLMLSIVTAIMVTGIIISFTLVSPLNNAWTSDTTPDFTFRAISDTTLTFPCELFVDGTLKATNASTNNNTNTLLTSTALSQGTHSWYINCTDVSVNQSEIRTINIDVTNPVVTLNSPASNYSTNLQEIDFKFNTTDNLDSSMSCALYIDGSNKKTDAAANNTLVTWAISDISRTLHLWYVNCTDNAGNVGQSETRNFTVEAIGYCDHGERGNNLTLTIQDPDSGDDFYPGDNITIKVKVKNNYDEDLDVTVEAELYDLTENDTVVDTEYETTIGDDTTKTITLKLRVPYNVDESNAFVVNVKAYEDEDEQCKESRIEIDIKKKSHSIIIEKALPEPDITSCGSSFNLDLEIANTGKNDEDIKLNIYSPGLFLNEIETFSLDENDNYENVFTFFVPSNITEASYPITIDAFYNYYDGSYHSSTRQITTLNIQGNCPLPPTSDVSFSALQTGDAFTARDFATKITITNTGNVETTYSITASGYEAWATLAKIEPSALTLEANSVNYAYITLKPFENITGVQTFTAKVSFNNITKEQTITVDVKKPTEAAPGWQQFVFEVKRNWAWIILIALLVAIVIILAVVLAKQARAKALHARQAESFKAVAEKLKEKVKANKEKKK